MAVFKCKMCGGDLAITEGNPVAKCEYCGSVQTVPGADNEKKLTLFSRANRLRFGCEFDKAAGVYESIIADFPEEAEAYWGLVLCKYGIEYVDDPATAKKIPTCHRSSFDPVLDDSNFEQVMENADAVARGVYREEAKQIEELRKGIIEVSSKEEPYDIFICYKETAEDGDRTVDSVIAQDVYNELTNKGYRVFFSRITLEDKLGQEYEPYIFAALNSSKIMLAFGTDYEYYNAVWVKNEWSRFLQLIAKGEKKTLIPCYKDIDAYDMPKEFAKLQAQDMGKIGAIQDLLRGIQKILPREAQKAEVTKTETVVIQQSTSNPTVDSLLKRAFMFLEDGDWTSADGYCEKVLDINPECAEAYLGKLMVELNVKKQEDLRDQTKAFNKNDNYKKALYFADDKLKAILSGYIEFIITRNKNAHLEKTYQQAKSDMVSAKTEDAYNNAAQLFESIKNYKDSNELAQMCLDKCAQLSATRKRCIELFEVLKSTIKNSDSVEQKIHDIRNEIQHLTKQKTQLESLCMTFPHDLANSNELQLEQKKLKSTLSELNLELSKLGLFSIKQKNIIKQDILNANKSLDELHQKMAEMIEKLQGFSSLEDIVQKINLYSKQINEQEKSLEDLEKLDMPSESEIIAELKTTSIGLEYLHDYQFMKSPGYCEVGEYIRFGSYTQDNNTSNSKKEIEWLVLEVKNRKALIISKYALDCMPYKQNKIFGVSWANSDIRFWLNHTFSDLAFTKSEKEMISSICFSDDGYPVKNSGTPNTIQDTVFLLSADEYNKLFSKPGTSTAHRCKPTAYAESKGIFRDDCTPEDYCSWWLRTSRNCRKDCAPYVYVAMAEEQGCRADFEGLTIRPALWLNLKKFKRNN